MLESELLSLILYSAQQLGIVLAVGGQTIVLVAYLIAMRDRVIDSQEAQFARAVRTVLVAGLGLIILSGLGISALHYLAGEYAILSAPAYLFKWILVVAVGLFTLGIGKGVVPQWMGEALAGGTWYALFFLHILAPVTTWENLLILYGGWLAAFALCWTALVFSTRERSAKMTIEPKKETPKTVPPPKPVPPPPVQKPPLAIPDIPSVRIQSPPPTVPPPPKPAPAEVILTQPKQLPQQPQPAPAAAQVHIPMQPSVAVTPAVSVPPMADAHPNLPAIRVMPKSPQDLK